MNLFFITVEREKTQKEKAKQNKTEKKYEIQKFREANE